MRKKERIYIGIDPGRTSGGLVFLLEDGGLRDFPELMPPFEELVSIASWAADHRDSVHVTIEDPEPSRAWGIKTMKSFFEHLGQLKALFPQAQLVNPKVWQAAMWTPESIKAVPYGKDTAKERSLYVAKQHWKSCTFRPMDKPGKPKDGLVDASLIALYGLMTKRGQFHS